MGRKEKGKEKERERRDGGRTPGLGMGFGNLKPNNTVLPTRSHFLILLTFPDTVTP